MRSTRALAALAVGSLLPGLLAVAAAPAGVAAEGDIPPTCPSTTLSSAEFAGDDFNPDTARAATWDYTAETPFRAVQSAGVSGDGWRLHADNPAEAGTVSTSTTSTVAVPAGNPAALALAHEYAFHTDAEGDHATGAVEILADGSWQELAAYSGSAGFATNYVDLSPYAGKSVTLRFSVTADGVAPAETATGWDIDDVSLQSCTMATKPGAPRSVTAVGHLGKATVKWAAPVASPTAPVTKYRITVSPGGRGRRSRDVAGPRRRGRVARRRGRGHRLRRRPDRPDGQARPAPGVAGRGHRPAAHPPAGARRPRAGPSRCTSTRSPGH